MKDRPILMSAAMVCATLDERKTKARRIIKPRPISQGRQPLISFNRGVAEWSFGPDDRDKRGLRWWRCPYGAPGDLLMVREAHAFPNDQVVIYRANWREDAEARGLDNIPADDSGIRWRPSIHMPRWASRLTLEITDIRVERLQDISEGDAISEGLYKSYPDDEGREWFKSYNEERGHEPTPGDWAQFEEGVWMVPGVPQGWGLTPAERRRDTWAPTPQFAYQLLWEHIHGKGSWAANPFVWVVSFLPHKTNIDAFKAERRAA